MSDYTQAENNALCDLAYAYVKGDGPEPYAPAVGSLLVLLRKVRDDERKRCEVLHLKAKGSST
jgi:hypothetical protein